MKNQIIKKDRIQIWVDAFQTTLGSQRAYRMRLKELETWDKPLNPKSDDPTFKWAEWARKIQALNELIN